MPGRGGQGPHGPNHNVHPHQAAEQGAGDWDPPCSHVQAPWPPEDFCYRDLWSLMWMNFKTWWQKRWLLSDGCGVKCIPNHGPLDKWQLSLPYTCLHAKLLQSCLTLCDPMDCSPPGSSVHRILQARILEWVAMPSFKGSSWPRAQTRSSCIVGSFFTMSVIWEAPLYSCPPTNPTFLSKKKIIEHQLHDCERIKWKMRKT